MDKLVYQDSVYNPILETNTKGFIDQSLLKEYKKNYKMGSVMSGMEYRPDLIAKYYLGDISRAWEILFINNFTGGIKDLKLGRIIKIPD